MQTLVKYVAITAIPVAVFSNGNNNIEPFIRNAWQNNPLITLLIISLPLTLVIVRRLLISYWLDVGGTVK